jgi:hypothetical protein
MNNIMQNKFIIPFLMIPIFVIQTFAAPVHVKQTKTITEAQKIEMLIAFIAKQEGTFIRNGSEYNASQAAEHLRMKWKKAGKAIKTAKDFIEHIASKSSMSGKPYQLKLKNGRTVNMANLLNAELERIEKVNPN